MDKGGKPSPTHETAAERAREQAESQEARDAEASIREKMADTRQRNQQAGRHGE